MKRPLSTLAAALIALATAGKARGEFLQEDRSRGGAHSALDGQRIEGLAVDSLGRILAGASDGLFREEADGGPIEPKRQWRKLLGGTFGKVRAVPGGDVHAASEARLFAIPLAGEPRLVLTHEDGIIHDFAVDAAGRIAVVGRHAKQAVVSWERDAALEPRDNLAFYSREGLRLRPSLPGDHAYAWCVAPDPGGAVWIGAKQGLLAWRGAGIERVSPPGEALWLLGEVMEGLHAASDRSLWYGTDTGITRHDSATGEWDGMRPETHGVPFPYARAVAGEPDRELWIGGEVGAARRDPRGRWTYYQGEAWLPHDGVLSIALGPGGRVLLGTESGLADITRTPMTLSRKAEHFERLAEERHTNRHGMVWRVHCTAAGDASTARESGYSDNDGLWTAGYVGAEALRHAVTGSKEARRNARRAMEAILLLETVTGIPGYPARSVALREDVAGNPSLERWHPSPDRVHVWKGDTSSDEVVGHYFAHALYFDHVAEESEKPRLRERVRALTDHILEKGLTLVEREDGEPTRWGIWSPERCWKWGHYWYSSRLWALCILSHLKVAHHITGEERYAAEYRRLIEEHDYARRTLDQKILFGYINHSDDQMAILSYYPLLRYETDPALRAIYLDSLRRSWEIERPEASPLWNFVQNWAAGDRTDLAASVEHLEKVPWMLFAWSHDNTRRWDLPLKPYLRGRAESSRALSMTERGPYYFTSNPYTLQSGEGGRTLESPVLYLLPYWLGRHHGLILEDD
ncbi:MAG TPA: hypothetical protein VMT52_15215 [Planctomycetota bacterium]|nr:hypothetical protein [Planctomycetota bacterium]